MKEYLFFRRGYRGCFIGLISVLLAICAMALSVKHQVSEHPSCGGMLGAGFPVIFLCDDWGGGSPTNSWGKITSVYGQSLEQTAIFTILFIKTLSAVCLPTRNLYPKAGLMVRIAGYRGLTQLVVVSAFSPR